MCRCGQLCVRLLRMRVGPIPIMFSVRGRPVHHGPVGLADVRVWCVRLGALGCGGVVDAPHPQPQSSIPHTYTHAHMHARACFSHTGTHQSQGHP